MQEVDTDKSDDAQPGIKWTKRKPADSDPWYEAKLDGANLCVEVAAECLWEWSVDHAAEGELARGCTLAEARIEDWDYQGAAFAKTVCEAVARAVLPLLAAEEPQP